ARSRGELERRDSRRRVELVDVDRAGAVLLGPEDLAGLVPGELVDEDRAAGGLRQGHARLIRAVLVHPVEGCDAAVGEVDGAVAVQGYAHAVAGGRKVEVLDEISRGAPRDARRHGQKNHEKGTQ